MCKPGENMALYTIGEVALLCDINPVTLRAWQRRYGLLKPQRTDGGHRLFTDADIDRIREIKGWIDNGVQVGKVKTLLSPEGQEEQDIWREQQEVLLRYLQSGHLHRLRVWLKDRGSEYPAQTLISHLFVPLRRRLQSQQPTLQALLSALDGVLINYICICLATARRRAGALAGAAAPGAVRRADAAGLVRRIPDRSAEAAAYPVAGAWLPRVPAERQLMVH